MHVYLQNKYISNSGNMWDVLFIELFDSVYDCFRCLAQAYKMHDVATNI